MTDDELTEKLEERQGAIAIRDELQAQIDLLKPEIEGALAERDRKKYVVGRWVPQIVVQERKTLDPKKLLQLGVTVDKIEAATSITVVTQLRVNPRGPEDKN
jgi:hypothetical protein